MSIRLDERRYVEELKRLVADFRMWKNPLVPLPDGFEDDLAWSNVAFLILFKTKIGFLGRSKILNLFQLPEPNWSESPEDAAYCQLTYIQIPQQLRKRRLKHQ